MCLRKKEETLREEKRTLVRGDQFLRQSFTLQQKKGSH